MNLAIFHYVKSICNLFFQSMLQIQQFILSLYDHNRDCDLRSNVEGEDRCHMNVRQKIHCTLSVKITSHQDNRMQASHKNTASIPGFSSRRQNISIKAFM
jgi:hypothetical protein